MTFMTISSSFMDGSSFTSKYLKNKAVTICNSNIARLLSVIERLEGKWEWGSLSTKAPSRPFRERVEPFSSFSTIAQKSPRIKLLRRREILLIHMDTVVLCTDDSLFGHFSTLSGRSSLWTSKSFHSRTMKLTSFGSIKLPTFSLSATTFRGIRPGIVGNLRRLSLITAFKYGNFWRTPMAGNSDDREGQSGIAWRSSSLSFEQILLSAMTA